MLCKVFAKKVPCVGPNSIRTVGTVIWLQSQSSGAHALLLNEVACLVNASVEDISKQARRLREVLSQKKIKCPKAALCARLSSLSRRILEHLDVPLTAFLALNLPSVAADCVKLDMQRCIDSTCDFVAIASFDEGCSPSGLAAAITFLSCSIAALNQQVYVSFARAAAVRQAHHRKRSLRTTLLPLLREPWGISISQCASIAGVHSDTALSRLNRLEAAFDECITRYFVAPPPRADCVSGAIASVASHQRQADVPAPRKRASRQALSSRTSTPPIILYNRIPIVLQVCCPPFLPMHKPCLQPPPPPQHLLFLSRVQFAASPAPDADDDAAALGGVSVAAASLQADVEVSQPCDGRDSDSSDLDRLLTCVLFPRVGVASCAVQLHFNSGAVAAQGDSFVDLRFCTIMHALWCAVLQLCRRSALEIARSCCLTHVLQLACWELVQGLMPSPKQHAASVRVPPSPAASRDGLVQTLSASGRARRGFAGAAVGVQNRDNN